MLHLAVGTGVWEPIIRAAGLDPVYTGAALRAAGRVQVTGFAVAAPVGTVLHAVLPSVFLACDRVAGGAGVSMIAAPGAPTIGRGLASFGADVMWLTAGLGLFWCWRARDRRIAIVGLLIQAQIAVHHLQEARVALADLDASGLPRAIQLAVPTAGWFTDDLARWPEPVRGMVFGLTLLVLGYARAALLLLVPGGLCRRLRTDRRARVQSAHFRWIGAMNRRSLLTGAVVAVATACSPLGDVAVGNTNWDTTGGATSFVSSSAISTTNTHGPTLMASGPTPARVIHPTDGSWQYIVDGSAETVRGVAYNPWYANLSPSQRASLYDRDFSTMHRLGINTIDGWFENRFDSVTLDAAARNGIGVLMPFELNQDLDYTDPAVRANILERLSAYVDQYRNHPAVRMWAPGNENMHRILFAHWVSQLNDPAARARKLRQWQHSGRSS